MDSRKRKHTQAPRRTSPRRAREPDGMRNVAALAAPYGWRLRPSWAGSCGGGFRGAPTASVVLSRRPSDSLSFVAPHARAPGSCVSFACCLRLGSRQAWSHDGHPEVCYQLSRPQVQGHCVHFPCVRPGPTQAAGCGAPAFGPGWREERGERPRAGLLRLHEPRGPPAIREETKRLFPLIWFYRDLRLTLNFACLPAILIFYSHFGKESPARRTIPAGWRGCAEGPGHGDQRPATRGCGGDAGRTPFPTSTLKSRSPHIPLSASPTRAPDLSAKSAWEAGARSRRDGETREPGGTGCEAGRSWQLPPPPPPPPLLGPPSAVPAPTPRLNYFQVWTT